MAEKKKTAGETAMEVYTFNPNNAPVRVQVINGEPWFVAKDVCQALGVEKYRDAVNRLDDDEKGCPVVVDTPGGLQSMTAVNESGLYNLIFQSRKAEARAFRKWVTGEVLPTLRKTGRYELKRKSEVVRRTRGERVNAEILNLLWLIGENLMHGDQKEVAMELGVSVQAVNGVLNGYNRSSRILGALYERATQNRRRNLLYTQPGVMAERLLASGADKKELKEGGAR